MSRLDNGVDAELKRLQAELHRRVAAHPVGCWSRSLLAAFIAVFDLVITEDPPEPIKRVNLRLV